MGKFALSSSTLSNWRFIHRPQRRKNAYKTIGSSFWRKIGNNYIKINICYLIFNMIICIQPKPTKGKMRIHCLENVDKALQFLKDQRVHLENMGSHDIVDGNPRLSLGLIWTIILRFQVCTNFNFYYLIY